MLSIKIKFAIFQKFQNNFLSRVEALCRCLCGSPSATVSAARGVPDGGRRGAGVYLSIVLLLRLLLLRAASQDKRSRQHARAARAGRASGQRRRQHNTPTGGEKDERIFAHTHTQFYGNYRIMDGLLWHTPASDVNRGP